VVLLHAFVRKNRSYRPVKSSELQQMRANRRE
jgi:hypothetical protein